jgi:hypothetical protein
MDPLGLWSWNPFELSRQEWDTVAAVAVVVALAATIATVTVATGGTAGLVLGAVATSATFVNAGIPGTGAGIDCVGGSTQDCVTGILNTGLSLFGFKAGGVLRGTAWTSHHVQTSAVERLAPDDFVNVRPDAQKLVDSMGAWDPASVDVTISNDFPEIAHVQALAPGGTAKVEILDLLEPRTLGHCDRDVKPRDDRWGKTRHRWRRI